MYNRVGLKTTRGSGTSGYVQTSKAIRRPIKSKLEFLKEMKRLKETQLPINLKPNEEILKHKQKRKIYSFLEELRETLKNSGKSEEEIAAVIKETENNLLERFNNNELVINLGEKEKSDTHVVAQVKQAEDEKLRKAFGIKDDYEIGNAFDFELQEREKLEKIYKRELERVNKMEMEALQNNNDEQIDNENIANENIELSQIKENEGIEDMNDVQIQNNVTELKEEEPIISHEVIDREADYIVTNEFKAPSHNYSSEKQSNKNKKDEIDDNHSHQKKEKPRFKQKKHREHKIKKDGKHKRKRSISSSSSLSD